VSRRPARQASGAAGLLVLLGVLTILAITFAAGTYAGRIWATKPERAGVEAESPRRDADTRTARMSEPAPRLTFYHELTAPLTAPPPPPKPVKSTAPPLLTEAAPAVARGLPDRAAASTPASTGRFTIQVGAYRQRPPAEALRTKLLAAGHDARVVETDAPSGVRFRVQIGDFTSRDAARDAAARLTGPTFVTSR
jgi:cell division protein FtsN